MLTKHHYSVLRARQRVFTKAKGILICMHVYVHVYVIDYVDACACVCVRAFASSRLSVPVFLVLMSSPCTII